MLSDAQTLGFLSVIGTNVEFESTIRGISFSPSTSGEIIEHVFATNSSYKPSGINEEALDAAITFSEQKIDQLESRGIRIATQWNHPPGLERFFKSHSSPLAISYMGDEDIFKLPGIAIYSPMDDNTYANAILSKLVQRVCESNCALIAHRGNKASRDAIIQVGALGRQPLMILPSPLDEMDTQGFVSGGDTVQDTFESAGVVVSSAFSWIDHSKRHPTGNSLVAGLCRALLVIDMSVEKDSGIVTSFTSLRKPVGLLNHLRRDYTVVNSVHYHKSTEDNVFLLKNASEILDFIGKASNSELGAV